MKKYKVINTQAVREKMVALGYNNVLRPQGNFLFLWADRTVFGSGIWKTDDYESETDFFDQSPYLYITQKDFLALQEPLKVGDWVKFENLGESIVFRIKSIGGDATSHYFQDDEDEPYHLSLCTKLTQAQIEMLGLK